MSPAAAAAKEEGYPLAPTHSGADDDDLDVDLPPPVSARRHKGITARLRAKFYSVRPRYRFLLVATATFVLVYATAKFTVPPDLAEEWVGRLPKPPGWHDEYEDDRGHGGPPKLPPPPAKQSGVWGDRAEEVKQAFLFAFRGYEELAFPHDELLPLSKRPIDNFNGWGVSSVDSLDTMLMMGLYDEYNRGVQHVAKLQYKAHNDFVPFFETSIRYFGGMLAAYAVTHDPILLQKAQELGDALLPAMNTPAGYPKFSVRPSDGRAKHFWGPNTLILAEMGSIQLEYKYLAHLTGKKEYYTKAQHIVDQMAQHVDPRAHLLSIFWNWDTGAPTGSHFSIGALADSGYEYILKQWVQSGGKETKIMDMWLNLANGIIKNLLYVSPERKLLYATDVNGNPSHVYEHLSCFLPGVFALGAHTLPLSASDRQLHLWVAEGLAQTCYISYRDQPSGLGPEEMQFTSQSSKWYPLYQDWIKQGGAVKGQMPPGVHKDEDLTPQRDPAKREYTNRKNTYLLRPETVEAIFVLYRVTGDAVWRKRGYEIFEAIEKKTKTDVGYASVSGVDREDPGKSDSMPSYFLAETLKYLWLLFRDDTDGRYDLKKVVFNTEAHPLPVFRWSKEEIKNFQIPI